jgi:CRISPR-associated protein Cas4
MPPWVQRGEVFDDVQHVLSRDRRFGRLAAANWRRERRVGLQSETLRLHGVADLVLRGPICFIVCDFKLGAAQMERGARLQLGAYALMAEEMWGQQCAGITVLTGRPVRALFSKWGEQERAATRAAIKELHAVMTATVLPHSPAGLAKCGICEHLNHCNDRD